MLLFSYGLLAFLLPVSSLLTLVTGFRAYPANPGRSHMETLNLIISVKHLFPNKVTFTGLVDISFGRGALFNQLYVGR